MKKIIVFLAIAAALCQPATAGELTFGWNLSVGNGQIWDMEFMPDNNFFIIMTDTEFQIRNTETGALVNSYPKPGYGAPQGFEFTPDSTRIILYCGDIMEVRNISDMSVIHHYVIPSGTDTSGYNIFQSSIRFREIAIDPIRPYIYAIRTREGTLLNTGKYFLIRRIVIYNYETMEEVGVLSLNEEDYTVFAKMAISNDGKYLSVNSELSSRLRVWDLETRQKIRTFRICNYDDASGEPTCTKFSELNTDLIYFSGRFPQKYSTESFYGILIYSISENKIIDSTFGVPPNLVFQGYFIFLDNEERAIKLEGWNIYLLNLRNKTIEQRIKQDTITNGPAYWADKAIYSPLNKAILGFASQYFSYARNDLGTTTNEPIHYDTIIYPNPNNGIVNLENNCQNTIQSYEILDIIGLILIPNTIITEQGGTISIDISSLPSGTYFLRFNCASSITTYKFIKED